MQFRMFVGFYSIRNGTLPCTVETSTFSEVEKIKGYENEPKPL
jgi:hypothetical protein